MSPTPRWKYTSVHDKPYGRQLRNRLDCRLGLLLCRHHHLLAHNNGWEIERAGPSYRLIPPDQRADAIDMPSRSPALHDALSA